MSVLGMDDRIGRRYLKVSVGFGGSCFKMFWRWFIFVKLMSYSKLRNFGSIVTINEFQKQRFATRILETMYGTVRGNFVFWVML